MQSAWHIQLIAIVMTNIVVFKTELHEINRLSESLITERLASFPAVFDRTVDGFQI